MKADNHFRSFLLSRMTPTSRQAKKKKDILRAEYRVKGVWPGCGCRLEQGVFPADGVAAVTARRQDPRSPATERTQTKRDTTGFFRHLLHPG